MSKRLITSGELFTVIKDTREKKGWEFPKTEYCYGTIIQKLETGDYSILSEGVSYENKFVIERKASTSEIANNIYETRFEKELVRLDEFEHSFIICEFTWNDVMMFPIGSTLPKHLWYKLKMTAEYMKSSLMRYMINHKVKIIFAGNQGQEVAMQLMKHYMRKKASESQNG